MNLLALEDGLALLGESAEALETVLRVEKGSVSGTLEPEPLVDGSSWGSIDRLLGSAEREGSCPSMSCSHKRAFIDIPEVSIISTMSAAASVEFCPSLAILSMRPGNSQLAEELVSSPSSRASFTSTLRPVKMSSMALLLPRRWVRRWVPPAPGMMPSLTSGRAKVVSG